VSLGAVVGFLFGVLGAVSPSTVHAAWINAAGTQFQVGGALTATIVPTAAGTSFADPACSSQGGTSLALVSGLKLSGVDPVANPVVLVVSCLDSGVPANRARLNFISPAGTVIKQLTTTQLSAPLTPFAPGNGWAHFVHRPDKGDLLACATTGALYSIDFSQTTTTVDGTATLLTSPGLTSCKGLTWDAEADVIYVGVTVGVTNSIVRFNDGATTALDFPAPCATNGLAVSGGVLLVSCQGTPLTIHRLDKNTGFSLGVFPTLTATGLAPLGAADPGLGSFACDPVTFHTDETGKDLFTDALWSRRAINGNGVVGLEFPAFTCGMPSSSVVLQAAVSYSPLAAGLGAPAAGPGAIPRVGCFDANRQVIDADGDGLPDCWETMGGGIDFDGDGANDVGLCVPVDTNGDGITNTTECASSTQKDLFVEIDYMQDHKPDPKALSQTQSPATIVNGVPVGVKSVREAFAAAPVTNPSPAGPGIKLHMQVDEQVKFFPLFGAETSHVNFVAFTPCTAPASTVSDQTQAVDFDTIKAANFGTATERGNPQTAANLKTLNAKRLAFRYVVFAHQVVGPPPTGGGANSSGCGEIGGDDAVISLGSFAQTTVNNVSHRRGTTDQQAGTFMHEFGHLLGFGHGGLDGVNCKPNYRSVMNYTRQFSGSPIPNRRLDYSRSADPEVLTNPALTGLLNEGSLNEAVGLGTDPSLGPIPTFFPSADQIVFGPNAWSLSLVSATTLPINWNRQSGTQTNATANINAGATSGCNGTGTLLEGHDDWGNVQYRASAAVNFAGGETSEEMTSNDELEFFQIVDADGFGDPDGTDCGVFLCTHRMNIPKGITSGLTQQGNIEVVIFSERAGSQVWNAPAQVILNDLGNFPITLRLEPVVIPVKVNNKGGGTCSAADRPDPRTGQKDGIKDLHCQFHVANLTLPTGTIFAVVSGFFLDPTTGEEEGFTARQEVTIQAVP
jgi:hypothetical protein